MSPTNRQFEPWTKCPQCRGDRLERFVEESCFKQRHGGLEYEIIIPDLEQVRCLRCREVFLEPPALQRMDEEIHRQLGLLSPEELVCARERCGLTQKDVHRLLGLGEFNISRWENGRVMQSRSTDTLLRLLYSSSGSIRELLQQIEADRCDGVARLAQASGTALLKK